MINGKQCTIVWYLDDKNWSYVNPNVVTYILELIKEHFGELVIIRVDEYDF